MARKASVALGSSPHALNYDNSFIIRPCLPIHDGIFHLGPDVLIASHPPHIHIKEHLHDHLYHMHIRYGFRIPNQSFSGIPKQGAALQVAMVIAKTQRVDCNPIFVAKGELGEGICLKIGGQDVHWVHDEGVAKKALSLFEGTGRALNSNLRFIGFSTSDLQERKVHRYSTRELKEAVGDGLRVDQHFQATWIEPQQVPIVPYEVTIFLSDDSTDYHTFFVLEPTISLSAF
jgi:hypothetical protein